MSVNITNVSNINGIYQAARIANEAADGLFWGIIMMVFFVILMVNFRNNGMPSAIAGSSFICLLCSLPLLYLGFIQIYYVIVLALLLASSLGIIFWTTP